MSQKRLLIIGATGVAIVALASQSWGNDRSESARVEPAPTARLTMAAAPAPVAPAKTAAVPAARPFDCLIEPSQVVKVSAPVEGVIARIDADRGSFVRRGQVLAQLQSDVEAVGLHMAKAKAENTFAVEGAKSRLEYLASKSARHDRLRQHLSATVVEEATAEAKVASNAASEAANQLRIARLEYQQAAKLLDQRIVRSPIDGVVTERVMAPGEFRANESSHILTVAQLNPLHVEVFAPISQVNDVRIGDRATVFPENPIGGQYKATVKIIDRVFDAASGTFGLRLELPNPGNKLPGGLRCRIDFDA